MNIGVSAGGLSPTIWVGRLNKDRTAFTSKENGTDMTLAAVARYVWNHCDGDLTCEVDGFEMQVIVEPFENGAS